LKRFLDEEVNFVEEETQRNWPEDTEVASAYEDIEGLFEDEGEMEQSLTAEVTSEGRHKCRTCGQVFNSLEEHNEHRRKMQGEHKTLASSMVG